MANDQPQALRTIEQFQEAGDHEAAIAACLDLIPLANDDTQPKVHLALSKLYLKENQPSLSLKHLHKAGQTLGSSSLEILQLKLLAYQEIGDEAQQLQSLSRLSEVEPENPRWPAETAVLLLRTKRAEEAIKCCEAAVNLGDSSLALQEVWGRSLFLAGNRRDAISKLETCRKLGSKRRGVWITLGMSYLVTHQTDKLSKDELRNAREVWKQIRASANTAVLLSNAAAFALETNSPEDAINDCERALQLDPSHAPSWFNLGAARNQIGDFPAAIQAHRKGLEVARTVGHAGYDFIRMNLTSLGANLSLLEDFETAHQCFDQVLESAPDDAECHLMKGCTYLKQGEFQRGWKHFEWRPRPSLQDNSQLEPWDGSNTLAGKSVLVRAEQGLGDTFQFCRFIPLLESKGASVVLDCQQQIRQILQEIGPFAVASNTDEAFRSVDYSVDLLSLPFLLGTKRDEVPNPNGYLNHPLRKNSIWRERLAKKAGEKLVGIAWRGNPQYSLDKFRSVSLGEFSPLLKVDSVKFISLQEESALIEKDIETLPNVHRFNDLDSSGSFMDSAEIVPQLDLVICTDSAVAHLAGALGCKVWVALSRYAEWRWMCKRLDTPWYSRMRLYRQQNFMEWRPVFESMARDLRAFVDGERC